MITDAIKFVFATATGVKDAAWEITKAAAGMASAGVEAGKSATEATTDAVKAVGQAAADTFFRK